MGERNGMRSAPEPANQSFLYVNLPGYKDGYAKMFAGCKDHISWANPSPNEFNPEDARPLLERWTGHPESRSWPSDTVAFTEKSPFFLPPCPDWHGASIN